MIRINSMLQLAFTLSPHLKETLQKIDEHRTKILLSLVPTKLQLHLQWNAQSTRIYYSFLLSRLEITQSEVTKILQRTGRKQPNEIERAVFNHKRAMDLISFEWGDEIQKVVTTKTVLSISEILFTGFRTNHAVNTYRVSDTPVKHLLEYLQSQHDHPVIQAGIVYSQFLLLSPFGERSEWVARILAYLFLYKNGFELKKLLVLEKYWYMTAPEYSHAFLTIRKDDNSNAWLNYFAGGVEQQMREVANELSSQKENIGSHKQFFYLSSRERIILDFLDSPGQRITNKIVQKLCKVSQITASRDLSRLSSLSLIFPQGKGRSVYYTKA